MRVDITGDALVRMDGKLFATSLPEDRPQPRQPGEQASRNEKQEQQPAAGGRRPKVKVDLTMEVVHRERRRIVPSFMARCWRMVKMLLAVAAVVSPLVWAVRRGGQGGQGAQRRLFWAQKVAKALPSPLAPPQWRRS
jgi:hypothetical protein